MTDKSLQCAIFSYRFGRLETIGMCRVSVSPSSYLSALLFCFLFLSHRRTAMMKGERNAEVEM